MKKNSVGFIGLGRMGMGMASKLAKAGVPLTVFDVRPEPMEAIVEQTVQRWFSDDFKAANPDVLDSVRAQIRGTNPLGYYGVIAAFLTLNFRDRIGQISAPTLFIGGDQSQYQIKDQEVEIKQFFPKARISMIKGAGHWVHFEKRKELVELIRVFCRKIH